MSSSPPSGVGGGNGDIDKLLGQMQDAFKVATETNVKITNLKTIEGSKLTVSQQRPNIG